ncbi:Ig-like domain-containing protein, partial [Sphingomicrobium sp. XHP0239]|uniref:Ig-like domain-containing protein n=1 Tax=Sphingomicrobium maritimum TaxID=3133972 RepID=UPI0031CCB8B4
MAQSAAGRDETDQALPENAVRVQPGPGGSVVLPEGVELSDITVVGRDLVVALPDGSFIIIEGGAIFVPQLVIDGVEVPSATLAALLIGDEEPRPAAGDTPSSGGNFAVDVGDLGPRAALGDLLPPTALDYTPPTFDLIGLGEVRDEVPDIDIDVPGNAVPQPDVIVSVDESGLPERGDEPAGTDPDADSETTSGTIIISSPDSDNPVGDVTINGVPVTGVGQVIEGDYGTIVITGIRPGEIDYDYTLTDNTSGDVEEVFTVVVTDPDGDTATGTITIVVTDDSPIARDDVVTLEAGDDDADGNVITGEGSDAGTGSADTLGADGFGGWGILIDGTPVLAGPEGLIVEGEYGTLTAGANGEWLYTRNDDADGTVTDTFTYFVRDGDGSESQATLTIVSTDTTPTVTLPQPGSPDGGTQVDEAGLPARGGEPAGSEASLDSETTSGSITYTDGDGASAVRIDGVLVTSVGQTFASQDGLGVLTVTSIADGSVGYSFTLLDNSAGDDTSVSYEVTVTDGDGDSATDTLVITIVDDTPDARDDSASGSEGTPITIDVFANDVEGADGVELDAIEYVEGSLTGRGSVAYNDDGSFTYTPGTGEDGTVTFQYRVTDGDGDSDIATVTIDLGADSEPTITLGGGDSVTEAGLDGPPAGEAPGSAAATDGETTRGTIAVDTGSDAVASLVIDGVDVTNGGVVAGDFGTLTVTGNPTDGYAYSYELTTNTDDGPGAETDSFTVTATDSDGDTRSSDLVITIVDDVPDARDDSASGSEGTPITIDVFANDVEGADGVELDAIEYVEGSLTGRGSVAYNDDGSFTYTPGTGEDGTVTFQYRVTDGDGDSDIATVTIDLGADSEPTITLGGGDSVTEAGLDGPPAGEAPGSAAATDGETTRGTIAVDTGSDAVASLVINGVDVTNGGVVAGDYGTLTVTGNPTDGYAYSYELTTNIDDGAGVESDDFEIVLTDSDSDTTTDTLAIAIVDDVPTANDDSATGVENRPVTVNVLGNDVEGADGVDLDDIAYVDGSLSGQGTVSYNGDGTFTYVPGAGESGTVTFDYVIVDGDGDRSVATVTITYPGDSVPLISIAGDTEVDEAGLDGPPAGEAPGSAAGSDEEVASGTIDVATGNDTVVSLVIDGVNVTNGGVVAGDFGTLTVTGNPTDGYAYSYELTTNTDDGPGAETDSFTVTATDSDGDTRSSDLVITIVDDTPDARDDSVNGASLAEGSPITVDVFANDTQGADGVPLGNIDYVAGSLTGTGTVVNNGDGTFTYNPGAGEDGTVRFQYRITDGDGDSDVATVTITLGADSEPQLTLAGGTRVEESGLDGPPAGEAPGSAASGNGEFTSGTIGVATGNDGVGSLVIDNVDVTNGGTVVGEFGTLTVTGNPSSGYSYTYELTDNTFDGAGAETDDFQVVLTDSDGDTTSDTLVITIGDDVPDARDDSATASDLQAGDTIDIDVFANDVQGADGVDLDDIALVAGSLNGAGSVVYNGDGTFTYTPGPNEEGTVTFRYRITDGDGDSDIATVTLTLARDDEPVISLAGETDVDEAGLPDGSDADADSEFADGTISIATGSDTLATLVIDGVDVTNGGIVTGESGTLTVTGNPTDGYTYTYQLTEATDDVDNVAETDTFTVVATDSDGSTDEAPLVITIADDTPDAIDDSVMADNNNAPVAIDVLDNDVTGADGVDAATGVSLVPNSITGTGSVTYDGAGTFTYIPGANETGEVQFRYQITDGDGDSDIAVVTIDLGSDDEPVISLAGETDVDESGLPEGSDADADSEFADGTISIATGSDTLATLVIDGVDV